MSIKYRPEIDGLRTVAVCAVLAYHAKLTAGQGQILPGGFLGVDLFFVISGYLITRIILGELASPQGFSFARFYERRARRILPALVTVMAVATVPAWLILLPTEFQRYAASLVASLFFFSNHFWHGELEEYGAQSSLLEPFVHTWSLGVEEQFYILLPIALIVLWRLSPRLILPVLLAAVVLGTAAAEMVTQVKPSLSFFWLPSRAWELLAGAVLAWGAENRPGQLRGPALARYLPSLGLSAILASMALVDLDAVVHPGFVTVPTVLGVCLVIWFADPRDPATRLLSSRPFVAVGLISYSLYLWHYPIFAFGRHISPVPALWEKGVWVVLSFALATLTYWLVEQPMRNRTLVPRRAVVGGGVAAALAVVAFFGAVRANDGFVDRFPRLLAIYGGDGFDNEALQDRSWDPIRALSPGDEPSAHQPSRFEAQELWFGGAPGIRRILIVGNSHSKDLFNTLHLNRERFPGVEFARFGMFARVPHGQQRQLFASPNFRAADTILLSFRWPERRNPQIEAFVRELLDRGKRVAIAGNTVEYATVGHLPLYDWYARHGSGSFSPDEINAIAWERIDPRTDRANAAIRQMARKMGLTYLDKTAYICDPAARRCEIAGPDGEKLLYDYGHYTLAGARRYGRKIAESGWLDPVLRGGES